MGKLLERGRGLAFAAVCCGALMGAALVTANARADQPGVAATAIVEQRFLRAIIDHHYSALRMSELAAGTQLEAPAADLDPQDETHPSPGFAPTAAKAQAPAVKSLARKNNRAQREEILAAQQLLLEFYGLSHVPQLSTEALAMIDRLAGVAPGAAFDQAFLRSLSMHHYEALTLVIDCLAGGELEHDALERYCRGILEAQLLEIEDMRHMLCKDYGDCGFVPFDTH